MSVWELPGKERDAPIGAFYGDRPASGMAQNMICQKYFLRQERDLPDGLRRMDPLVHRALRALIEWECFLCAVMVTRLEKFTSSTNGRVHDRENHGGYICIACCRYSAVLRQRVWTS